MLIHFSSLIFPCLFLLSPATAQVTPPGPFHRTIAFVSDTQAPMWVETIFLRSNHNTEATALVFGEIQRQRPDDLFLLGDVVNLGCKNNRWMVVDGYLQRARSEGISVFGILGNHDVMTRPKAGIKNFQERFPDHRETGYDVEIDSIAVILLNSNFKTLSAEQKETQNRWYESTLNSLEKSPAVKVIIVCCHHAPYSNSKIVGSSGPVQENFVPAFLRSKKSILFISGHAHAFEHFQKEGKDFLTIGGGGGLHQPLRVGKKSIPDLAKDYKPMFHFLQMKLNGNRLQIISRRLTEDFKGFEDGLSFGIDLPH